MPTKIRIGVIFPVEHESFVVYNLLVQLNIKLLLVNAYAARTRHRRHISPCVSELNRVATQSYCSSALRFCRFHLPASVLDISLLSGKMELCFTLRETNDGERFSERLSSNWHDPD